MVSLQEDNLVEHEEVRKGAGSLMDSKTSHLDDELAARLEDAFHKITFNVHLHDVAKIANEYKPIDLAYAASRLPSSLRPVLYEKLPNVDARRAFMINTDGTTRSAIFRSLDDKAMVELIEKMAADDVVWILEDIPLRRCRRILEKLDVKKASVIRELQKHSRKSAGGLMTNEYFAFPMETTIAEVSGTIRDNPGIDLTRVIFVFDHEGKLIGYVPGRNLIVNPPGLPLKQVMRQIDYKVTPTTTREEVVDLVERYKIPALAVVDEKNFLTGVITYEEVVEAMEDIADETVAWMAGTIEDVGQFDHIFRRFLARAPWLIVTLFGGMISATIMSYFQGIEGKMLAFVVLFVPLINGMSGNVGLQCSTVLVRSMAIGAISKGKRGEAMRKEWTIGLLTGVIFGALAGIIIYLLNLFGIQEFGSNPYEIATLVALGVLGACSVATCLGVTAPFFFVRIGVDPAVASGPIVTAFNDILSMSAYFLIAGLLGALFF